MAAVNRPTHKQNSDDFINRQPPYDAEPLIQKSEDDIIRDEMADSAVFRVPTTATVGSPAAAINVDFETADRHDIDFSSTTGTAFTITLQNLNDNETGLLNITKQSGDTITFTNGLIVPFNNTNGQVGQTNIIFFVKIVAGTYVVQSGFDVGAASGDLQGNYPNLTLKNDVVGSAEIVAGAVGNSELASNAVTLAKMADNSVGSAEIVAGAVGNSELASNAVTNAKMADNSVDTNELVNDSVTFEKIGFDALRVLDSGTESVSAVLSSGTDVVSFSGDGSTDYVLVIYPDNDTWQSWGITTRTSSSFTIDWKKSGGLFLSFVWVVLGRP